MSGLPGAGHGRRITQVAVGVVLRPDGAVLMADRPAGKPYAGYWEFPGGKVEAGESVEQALARELAEELGIRIGASLPWAVIEHDYPHAYVRLHFRRIWHWEGSPRGAEGQHLRFLAPGEAPPAPLLPAAIPALRWLRLPSVLGASPGTARTQAEALAWLERALERGVRLLVWYEPALDAPQRAATREACQALAREYGADLLADLREGPAAGLAPGPGPAAAALGDPASDGPGVYVPSAWLDRPGTGQLTPLRPPATPPPTALLGAGVRDRAGLARALALGCDFAVVDATGPQAWDLAREAPLPLYWRAVPGAAALAAAQAQGFHGLAQTGA